MDRLVQSLDRSLRLFERLQRCGFFVSKPFELRQLRLHTLGHSAGTCRGLCRDRTGTVRGLYTHLHRRQLSR
jgi:hypothetical protein